jgi:hypothetical protein
MSGTKRYPCTLCWLDSNGTKEVPSVRGFNLDLGGNWYACEKHLNDPMFQPRNKENKE